MAVPGELFGYLEAKNRFGNPEISWQDIVGPTLRMCETGIPVTGSVAKALRKKEAEVRSDPGMK